MVPCGGGGNMVDTHTHAHTLAVHIECAGEEVALLQDGRFGCALRLSWHFLIDLPVKQSAHKLRRGGLHMQA